MRLYSDDTKLSFKTEMNRMLLDSVHTFVPFSLSLLSRFLRSLCKYINIFNDFLN